jgi:predicted Rossmann-fold nucleotide-binding protein
LFASLNPVVVALDLHRSFWEKAIHVPHFVDEGLIAAEDVHLFRYADTAEEAWRHIVDYYAEGRED